MAREKTEKGKETRVFQCFLPTPLASVFVSFVIVIFLEFENFAAGLVGWRASQGTLVLLARAGRVRFVYMSRI